MSPVTLAELDPVTRQRALEQIHADEISNLDISDRAALIERLKKLHNGTKQAYALRDEQRREAGKILLALRKTTSHGDWEPQLKQICQNIGMSRATAHNYMNAFERGSVPKQDSPEAEKAKATAQRLQDACREVGLNVSISPSKELGKFHLTYRNLSETEIVLAIADSCAAKRGIK